MTAFTAFTAFIEGEITDVEESDRWRRAIDEVHYLDAEQARQLRALICWHHLYRWPNIRLAASMAYTQERYDFLMYLADHAGPDAATAALGYRGAAGRGRIARTGA